jgi:hypothetical protein
MYFETKYYSPRRDKEYPSFLAPDRDERTAEDLESVFSELDEAVYHNVHAPARLLDANVSCLVIRRRPIAYTIRPVIGALRENLRGCGLALEFKRRP